MTVTSTIMSGRGEQLQLLSGYCYRTAAVSKRCDNILPPPAASTSSAWPETNARFSL
jgi:hypothetical protein